MGYTPFPLWYIWIMLKKVLLILVALFFLSSKSSFALTPLPYQNGYYVSSFDSKIQVNKDTSLTITENIQTNFIEPKHGIIRVIPVIYSANGRTINADFKVISITDERNNPYNFTVSTFNQSKKIQIGDADKTITGTNYYLIKYDIKGIILRYDDHDEVYWNALGGEWDTNVFKTTATVYSDFAPIIKTDCFSGPVSKRDKTCTIKPEKNIAEFIAQTSLGPKSDLTVVVGLDNQNQLVFPGVTEQTFNTISANWGYLTALLPLIVLFVFWYFKGRDLRYTSDNVYVKPDNKTTRKVNLFEREHLPMVYSPINGLSPSQVGTIIDEKVDTKDVIAEIVELARLGFLTIKKTEKKGFLHKDTDYTFTKIEKNTGKLNDYQNYLLESIFGEENETSVSKLKNHFYSHLNSFKSKLYKNLVETKIFANNPQTIKGLWVFLYVVMMFICFGLVFSFAAASLNGGPTIVYFISIIPAIFLIKNMPRRTAWGHSLYRQTVGLKYYIGEGKWRQEIAEKNLFLQEILPLAIALGVVDKLAKDMKDLAIEPPSYLNGFTAAYLVSDLNHFSNQTASALTTAPSSSGFSGHSSWSGGSGFSGGGFSGGGFGGGGGSSW